MAPVRRGGRGTLPDGVLLTWSLAEGGRGRRWRATRIVDGRLDATLLLEVDAAGRTDRLELSGAEGLLTLHPSADRRELHGNVVTPDGIRHLRFDWSRDHELVVAGFPVALMPALRARRQPGDRPAVIVGADLRPRPGSVDLDRLGGEFAIDADGAPAGLADAQGWPLEEA
jgi:hypothetical protein